MYCPGCGAINSTDQRFCRKCGMNLKSSARSLLEQFPAGNEPGLALRERRIEKFGQIAFNGFVVVLVLGVLGLFYAILDRMVFSGERPLVGVLLMAFILFAMLTLAYVFLKEDLKDKRSKALPVAQTPLQMPAITARLIEEREFEPTLAVTESTTDLLPTRNREP